MPSRLRRVASWMYGRAAIEVSGIGGAPNPGEDLPPLRKIPVAEGLPRNERIGDPRAASQHAVLVSEEDLGVLGVRERAKGRITVEERRSPLPDGALSVLELAVEGLHGLLPLLLRRQALTRPASVGVGLVERDVLHRLVVATPAGRRSKPRVLGIGHEGAVDPEGREVDDVRRPLVVVGPRLA